MLVLLFIFLVNAAIPLAHFYTHQDPMSELLMPLLLPMLSSLRPTEIVMINASLLSAVVG